MSTTPIFRRAALAAAVALAAGCASDAGLKPQARMRDADQLQATATLARAQVSPAAWPARDWWRRYSDPQLDRLVDEALAASPSMRIAEARVRQAAAAAGIAGAALSPQVTGAARSNRVAYSENSNVPKPLAGSWKWSNEASLNFSHELDFWGKNQATLDAAMGREKAAEVEVEAARLVLTVGITQTYLRLSQLYAQRDLGEDVLRQRRQVLELTERRVAASIDSQADLKQAQLAIPLARTELATADEAIALVRAQLAALLGAGPDRGAAIERPQLKLARPAAVPAMLPSVLLARRPDVVAQRWRVESLGRDIDAAKAQFYPSINLNGLIGLQSLGFSHLLQGGSMIAGAGAGLSLPIFDGGRLRGNLALRNADYDVAVEAYNQTLIEALRDVVSQLVSIEWLGERGTLQAQALETAQQAYDLSLRRYRSGVGNYLQVLASQIQVLQQQRAQIDLDTRAFDLDMQLARALGGGYSTPSSR
ncbi:efflux transporter outer membrane subunit [Duganella aceris]|uniref:Efflux transporter outer membrane subunit n=1 Tax=Duganella aceris TaxID=2703883 RepID=A0ABX0FF23_9BURK|nr:efflux transporter outer membrane subunit [Duganella aceris]NGZ83136.1 efflux transporter outer membrane subunit [Duganella aceris]